MTSLSLSPRHSLAAVIVALACSLATFALLPPAYWALGVLLVVALVWASAVDIVRLILPDPLTLGLMFVGVAIGLLTNGVVEVIAGAAIGYGVIAVVAYYFRKVRGVSGIGMGDAKLLGAAGAWVGPSAVPGILLLSCLFGLFCFAAGALRNRQLSRITAIPFGPSIALAFWIIWMAQVSGHLQSS